MSNVIVIGGGAAGMTAALAAARNGHQTALYEKNEKLGKKIYITGKGRCNLTNACDTEDFFANVVRNPKFLYSSIYSFTNQDIIDLVERYGCPVKTERGGRVFPVSDHSSDVIRALDRALRDAGVQVHLYEEIAGVETAEGQVTGVRLKKAAGRSRQTPSSWPPAAFPIPLPAPPGTATASERKRDTPSQSCPRLWCRSWCGSRRK